jgi:hypothetical protein
MRSKLALLVALFVLSALVFVMILAQRTTFPQPLYSPAMAAEVHTVQFQEPVTQKIVPILSVGSGTRVGGAVVTGDPKQVSKVVAVGQLDASYQSVVRIRILVPVSTTNVVQNISRVPGTSVIGLVDIGL